MKKTNAADAQKTSLREILKLVYAKHSMAKNEDNTTDDEWWDFAETLSDIEGILEESISVL